MDFNEYQKKAMVTKCPYESNKDQIVNALLGIAGETGEIHEMFKKHYTVGGELDLENLRKEIGDVLWYLAELCDAFGFTMEDCAEKNIAKLKARHGAKFSGNGDRSGAGK